MNGSITLGKPPAEPPHEMLARMRVELPPEIRPTLDEPHAAKDKVRQDKKYTEVAKQELIREIEQAARVRFDAAYEKLHAERQKEVDREEGQLRRELLN